jgi:PAS domain S-box-containing protein
VIQQSPASIVITNMDARIEYVNEAFLKNTGYSPDEVLGQNPRLLLHAGKPGQHLCRPVVHPDGRRRYGKANSSTGARMAANTWKPW